MYTLCGKYSINQHEGVQGFLGLSGPATALTTHLQRTAGATQRTLHSSPESPLVVSDRVFLIGCIYIYSIHPQPALWASVWVDKIKSLSPLVKWWMLLSTLLTLVQKTDWVVCLQVNSMQGMNGALPYPSLFLLHLTSSRASSFLLLLFFMRPNLTCPWLIIPIFSNAACSLLWVILFWHSWAHTWEQVTSVSFNCFFFLVRGRQKD